MYITILLCYMWIGVEKNWHIFIDCPYAKEYWQIAMLDSLVQINGTDYNNFSKWIFESLNKCPSPMMPKFAAVLWSMWRYRNEKLWNGVSRPPQITISLVNEIFTNWNQAQVKSPQIQNQNSRHDVDGRWTKPSDPTLKCFDAAIFKDLNSIGWSNGARPNRYINGE